MSVIPDTPRATRPRDPIAGVSHRIPYVVLNHDLADPRRPVDVHASPAEIRQLTGQGYLVRERMFQGDALEVLRDAVDELERRERVGHPPVGGQARFGGLFMRHLMDKHPAFLDLVRHPPTLSVARAMFGPLVRLRGMVARITYPGEPNQETHWHFHQRVASRPLPPWFVPPHGLDCLIYLDDLDQASGPVALVPGSHRDWLRELPGGCFADLPGQQVLEIKAGGCVMMHGNLWHRALPTRPDGHRRRLLIIGYVPTWMRSDPCGVKPPQGLTNALLTDGDGEIQELLGVGGYT